MSNIFEDVNTKILREIGLLKSALRALQAGSRSLFPVLNENTPAQIVANTNDYAPGDYAVLRLSTDASRNITGLSDGKKGRVLWIHNVGSFAIVLVNESALSVAANRLLSATAANITISANDSARLYYDSTTLRWRITVVTS